MKINTRQQLYKQNRLAGMSQYNAARSAGYSDRYAKVACRIEQSVKVSMADAFERAGLTDKAIVEHALEGLKADKVISCNVIALSGEGMKDANSMTKDFVDVPDWSNRHRYFETILKLTDRLRDKVETSIKVEVNVFTEKLNQARSRVPFLSNISQN